MSSPTVEPGLLLAARSRVGAALSALRAALLSQAESAASRDAIHELLEALDEIDGCLALGQVEEAEELAQAFASHAVLPPSAVNLAATVSLELRELVEFALTSHGADEAGW